MSERSNILLKKFRECDDLINDRLRYNIEHSRKHKGRVKVVGADGKPVPGAKVKLTLRDHDFKFGANIFMLDEFECDEKNALYRDTFADVFNIATVPFYWADLEPIKGQPRFSKDSPKIYRRPAPDLCVEYCKEKRITPKAHCLNYDTWSPLWLDNDTDTVKYYLEKRMAECAERYRTTIPGWEVTNELFCGHYSIFEQNRHATNFFWDRDVVEWSFETARKYFPNNELIINEAAHAWTGLFEHRRGKYYMQIERALLKGAPVDAVGLQYHMFTRKENEVNYTKLFYDPEHLYNVMDTYADFGLPMQVTEVTIPCYTADEEDEQLQADILEYLMKIWFSHPNMEAVVYWNLVDGYAAFAPQGDMEAGENYYRGGLMRFDMTPKPAVEMFKRLFKKTWHTEAGFDCDDGGYGTFKGFDGWYDVEVIADGKVTNTEIHLTKKSLNDFRIVI